MKRNTIISSAQKSVAEVREALDQYLEGVKHDLSLSSIGTTVYVNLVYYDFKPRRVVRNEIEDIAPNIEVDNIRREYSDAAIVDAYYEDIDNPQQIYIRLDNGEMIPTTLSTLLVERMSRRNYCKRA